jgi:hypothetical protein
LFAIHPLVPDHGELASEQKHDNTLRRVKTPRISITLDFDNDGDIDLADFAAMQRLSWNQ